MKIKTIYLKNQLVLILDPLHVDAADLKVKEKFTKSLMDFMDIKN